MAESYAAPVSEQISSLKKAKTSIALNANPATMPALQRTRK
jgi:hypothetical protein